MAFENLKSTGIKYLLGKLKDVFVQIKDAVKSVNGNEPDENGNITINEVPYAENLISDSTQTSHDSFILRTAGGTASIESGDAWLMDIKGNSVHEGFTAESLSMVVNAAEREEGDPITATIDRDTFVAYVDESGTITLSYTTAWDANPATYGVTITGTPVNGDSIVITYVKEVRGIIYQSNPQAFRSTGWNLYNHSDGCARVVKYSDDFGFRIEGTYTAIQYSATQSGARSSITVSSGNFTVPGDGFIWVTGGNSSDTAIYMTWSDWTEGANGGTFEAYEETTVDLSSLFTGEGCPFPYGLLNVGTVSDEVNLNLGTATKRVERLAYNATNLATAKASGREYDYDTDYIYLALATPETVAVTIDGSFTANDHGMEIFDQTDVAVTTQILYGNNLKNKLERDTLTKSGDLVDNLTTNDGTKVLSAKQGKVLNDKITYKELSGISSQSALDTALTNWLSNMSTVSKDMLTFSPSASFGYFVSGERYYVEISKSLSSTYSTAIITRNSSTNLITAGKQSTGWKYDSISDRIGSMQYVVLGQVPANSTKTITLGSSTRALLLVIGSGDSKGAWIISSTSGSNASSFELASQSGVSATASGSTVVITNSSSTNPGTIALVFVGSVSTS